MRSRDQRTGRRLLATIGGLALLATILQLTVVPAPPPAAAAATQQPPAEPLPPAVVLYGGQTPMGDSATNPDYFAGVSGTKSTPSGHSFATQAVPGWQFAPGVVPAYSTAIGTGKIALGSIPSYAGLDVHTQNTMSASVFDPSPSNPANASFKHIDVPAKCVPAPTPPTPCPTPAPPAQPGSDIAGLCTNSTGDRAYGFASTPYIPYVSPAPTNAFVPAEYPTTYAAVVGLHDTGGAGANSVVLDPTKTLTPWDVTASNTGNTNPPTGEVALPSAVDIYGKYTDSSPSVTWCARLASGDMVLTQYYPAPFNHYDGRICGQSTLYQGFQPVPNRYSCSGRLMVFGPDGALKSSFQIPNYQQTASNGQNYTLIMSPKKVVASGTSVSPTDQRFYVNYDAFWKQAGAPGTALFPTQEFSYNPQTSVITPLSRPVVTTTSASDPTPMAFNAGYAVDGEGTLFAERKSAFRAAPVAVFPPPTTAASIFPGDNAFQGSDICGSLTAPVTAPPQPPDTTLLPTTPCPMGIVTPPFELEEATYLDSDIAVWPQAWNEIIIDATGPPTPANPERLMLLSNQGRVRPLTWSGWNRSTDPWTPYPRGISADVNLGIDRLVPWKDQQVTANPARASASSTVVVGAPGEPNHLLAPIIELVTAKDGNGAFYKLKTPNQFMASIDIDQMYARPRATFHAMAPTRALDSRTVPPNVVGWSGKLAAGAPRSLQVGGANGVPANATAVVMNVTVTGSTSDSFLSAYPTGTTTTSSNINFAGNQTTANLVTVQIGAGGFVDFSTNLGEVDVVADITGYYASTVEPGGLAFRSMAPTRALDSRTVLPNVVGWSGKLAAGAPRSLKVAGGDAGVPANATAVVMNVTVTGSNANSFLTAYPAGASTNSSNINFAVNQTTANLVTVQIGAGGYVDFSTALGDVDVIADITGYFNATVNAGALEFYPLTPTRALDSRTVPPNVVGFSGKVDAGAPRALQIVPPTSRLTDGNGLPAKVSAVIMNVTVTGSNANSFLTVYPTGATTNSSNINFAANQTIANLVVVQVGTGGTVSFSTAAGSVDVVADIVGYYDLGPGF